MQQITDGLSEAFRMMLAGESLVYSAAWRSLWISSTAVALAMVLGLPLGIWLARTQFPGNRLLVILFRAGMALPTVFVGILCYGLFSRRGPLGALELLYTPQAIIFGELLLAIPIVVGICHGGIQSLDPRVAETAWTLGVSRWRRWATYISEARTSVTLALLTAFARCVTELGIAMIVGGNILHRTRTLATAAALETSKGELARGMALGMILLIIALVVAATIGWLSREQQR